jgi:Flp pilus assembly protein TadG
MRLWSGNGVHRQTRAVAMSMRTWRERGVRRWAAGVGRPCRRATALGADRHGVATIELAIILPVVTVLMLGALDLGILVHREMDLRQAARAGAQYALQDATDHDAIRRTAIDALGPQSNAPQATATVTTACECPTSPGDLATATTVGCGTPTCAATGKNPATYVTVTVSQAYAPLFGSWGVVGARTMTANAILRVN